MPVIKQTQEFPESASSDADIPYFKSKFDDILSNNTKEMKLTDTPKNIDESGIPPIILQIDRIAELLIVNAKSGIWSSSGIGRIRAALLRALDEGKTASANASQTLLDVSVAAQRVLSAIPESLLPTARWSGDKLPKEKCDAFLLRVWGELIRAGKFSRQQLRQTDFALYQAVAVFFGRHGVPDELTEWWKASPQITPTELAIRNTELINKLNLKNPSDALNAGLPRKEAIRLYEAMRRRKR